MSAYRPQGDWIPLRERAPLQNEIVAIKRMNRVSYVRWDGGAIAETKDDDGETISRIHLTGDDEWMSLEAAP